MEPREKPLVGFWDRPQAELLGLLHATPSGLTSDEAKRRLRLHGPNSLVRERRFAGLLSLGRFFANPLIIVLLVASAVSLSLGDRVGGTRGGLAAPSKGSRQAPDPTVATRKRRAMRQRERP
jgi:Mg2+-importing ATPase